MTTRRELRAIVKGFRKGVLEGAPSDSMCYAVCAPLQSLLGAFGIDTELVELDFSSNDNFMVMNHYVLRMKDGNVIDPTADQFGLPAVYIGPMPAIYGEP